MFVAGSGTALFDHIAQCLAEFVHDREIQDEILPLGFTFSFPCEQVIRKCQSYVPGQTDKFDMFQEGLARARLVKWTKGFNCAGVEGEDVVQLLQEAIARRGDVKIEVCAILNDTTGKHEFDFYKKTQSKAKKI